MQALIPTARSWYLLYPGVITKDIWEKKIWLVAGQEI